MQEQGEGAALSPCQIRHVRHAATPQFRALIVWRIVVLWRIGAAAPGGCGGTEGARSVSR